MAIYQHEVAIRGCKMKEKVNAQHFNKLTPKTGALMIVNEDCKWRCMTIARPRQLLGGTIQIFAASFCYIHKVSERQMFQKNMNYFQYAQVIAESHSSIIQSSIKSLELSLSRGINCMCRLSGFHNRESKSLACLWLYEGSNQCDHQNVRIFNQMIITDII